ncbi:YdaU family protein [Undibacterium sp. SXout7W]|uniref:YdaU family protein n=1 Tax=Undibacterium sp. SXout7W TaxID=3413049 RepID=UPI003BF45B24
MNYYSHHIGDFNNATRHLTRVERSIYRDMLDMYYDTEQPLTLDFNTLCRKLLARSNEESTAVEQVLNEFFIKTESGWFHSRCDEEIAEYLETNTAKSKAGKASAAKRAEEKERRLAELNKTSTENQQHSTDVEHVLDYVGSSVQRTNNQEPITNNQEPNKPNTTPPAAAVAPKFDFAKSLTELGADPKAVADWMKVRKTKKADNTETALAGFLREAQIAGLTVADAVLLCAEKSWRGLDATWVKPKVSTQEPRAGQQLGKHGQATAENARLWLESQKKLEGVQA